MQGPILVIEVGGTYLRAARFEPEVRELSNRRREHVTNFLSSGRSVDELQQDLLEAMGRLGHVVLDKKRPGVVGIAYPGPIDKDGVAFATPTLLGDNRSQPVPIRDACKSVWPDARVFVMNDLTAAGHRYVEVGLRDFCIITVGSGVGHKVFLAGRPQVGEGGRGGEIGHLRVDFRPDALACDCGGRGHVGALASARGTIRMARAAAERDPMGFSQSSLSRLAHRDDAGAFNPTGEEIAFAFSASDAWASNVVRTAASYLGIALAAIHLDVGIERFVVIGGFALALGERYRQILVEAASAASWDVGQEWNRMIELGLPDDDHGMIGAGIVASDQGATR